jgi:hypothetical protein
MGSDTGSEKANPLAYLSPQAVAKLASILTYAPPDGNIVPSKEWLLEQERRISKLPRDLHLHRQLTLVTFFRIDGLYINRLCEYHKQLKPELIWWCSNQLYAEFGQHSRAYRRYRKRLGDQCPEDIREFIYRLGSIAHLYMGPKEFRLLFGFTLPEEYRYPHIRSDCVACVLAVVGGQAQMLVDLRANMLGRAKHKTPRLLPLVDAWIAGFRDYQTDMRQESGALGGELLRVRQVVMAARAERRHRHRGEADNEHRSVSERPSTSNSHASSKGDKLRKRDKLAAIFGFGNRSRSRGSHHGSSSRPGSSTSHHGSSGSHGDLPTRPDTSNTFYSATSLPLDSHHGPNHSEEQHSQAPKRYSSRAAAEAAAKASGLLERDDGDGDGERPRGRSRSRGPGNAPTGRHSYAASSVYSTDDFGEPLSPKSKPSRTRPGEKSKASDVACNEQDRHTIFCPSSDEEDQEQDDELDENGQYIPPYKFWQMQKEKEEKKKAAQAVKEANGRRKPTVSGCIRLADDVAAGYRNISELDDVAEEYRSERELEGFHGVQRASRTERNTAASGGSWTSSVASTVRTARESIHQEEQDLKEAVRRSLLARPGAKAPSTVGAGIDEEELDPDDSYSVVYEDEREYLKKRMSRMSPVKEQDEGRAGARNSVVGTRWSTPRGRARV